MTKPVPRSVLCVPGHDQHKVANCRQWGADQVLFDLEDAVPDGSKRVALGNVLAAVRRGDIVRVCRERALQRYQLDVLSDCYGLTVWVPKVEQPSELDEALSSGRFSVWALVETPLGVLNSLPIAHASEGLAFGRYDFMAATGITDIWSPLVDHAMGQVALAAHAAGVPASDSPCYSTTDVDLMAREVARARGMGYASKGCIHPAQITACAAMAPTMEELHSAREVLAAPLGVSLRDNRLVGPPMVKLAKRVLDGS